MIFDFYCHILSLFGFTWIMLLTMFEPIALFLSVVCKLGHPHRMLCNASKQQTLWKQQCYELVRFLARYSFLHSWAGLDEVRVKRRYRLIWYTLAANFASRVGACAGIVEPFKHLLCVTAHPQILALVNELQTPMGTCPGQYNGIPCKLSLAIESLAKQVVGNSARFWERG